MCVRHDVATSSVTRGHATQWGQSRQIESETDKLKQKQKVFYCFIYSKMRSYNCTVRHASSWCLSNVYTCFYFLPTNTLKVNIHQKSPQSKRVGCFLFVVVVVVTETSRLLFWRVDAKTSEFRKLYFWHSKRKGVLWQTKIRKFTFLLTFNQYRNEYETMDWAPKKVNQQFVLMMNGRIPPSQEIHLYQSADITHPCSVWFIRNYNMTHLQADPTVTLNRALHITNQKDWRRRAASGHFIFFRGHK